MMCRYLVVGVALLIAGGCMGPESTPQLDTEIKVVKASIAQDRAELSTHQKGTVLHDLVTLRLAIREQTLAMMEQRRASGSWRTKLEYTVDGKPYVAPADADKRVTQLEARIRKLQAGRESDLKQAHEGAEVARSLYMMSAGTKAATIAQLEYQVLAYRHGFPPYYVPFVAPKRGAAPPQIIEVPAGKAAVVQ